LLDRLEHALNARRDFLADVSHELRTPVSIARAAADVTLARAWRSEAEYREALSVISVQMKRLTAMVGDLLTLARSDITDWPIVRQDFYFDELLHEVIRAMRVLADERHVTMRASCPADTQIAGDEQLLRQMLFNLLENAVRHTPSGGVVEVVAESSSGELRVAVCDTGTGIAAPRRDRLFERFGRLDSHSHHGRMGLGLAIGRRIARAHGGDLTLVATGPAGSTFGVTIPRA
jgi:two-component system, OmpR family, sensor kinase